jgi:cyanate permease
MVVGFTMQSVHITTDVVSSCLADNISVISWQSVVLVEETGWPGENHRPVASHWQTLSHNIVHLVLIETRTHNISDQTNKNKQIFIFKYVLDWFVAIYLSLKIFINETSTTWIRRIISRLQCLIQWKSWKVFLSFVLWNNLWEKILSSICIIFTIRIN